VENFYCETQSSLETVIGETELGALSLEISEKEVQANCGKDQRGPGRFVHVVSFRTNTFAIGVPIPGAAQSVCVPHF
jgi:hypothetical protein